MKHIFLIILLCVSASMRGACAADSAKPNILVIYTDDQGFGDTSCYNPQSKIQTPNLDKLAAGGMRFTDAHCSDTVCTPSRYGLLTGRYSWRTTLKKGVFGAEHPCLIADGRMTLASLCRDHGYVTAMVGKWHLGMDFPGEKGARDWSQPVKDMPLDGRDIWPVLTRAAKSPHDALLLAGTSPDVRAVRMGDWKLLVNPSDKDAEEAGGETVSGGVKVELYNLADDISEKHNLAATHPEKVKELRARLDAFMKDAVSGDSVHSKGGKGGKRAAGKSQTTNPDGE